MIFFRYRKLIPVGLEKTHRFPCTAANDERAIPRWHIRFDSYLIHEVERLITITDTSTHAFIIKAVKKRLLKTLDKNDEPSQHITLKEFTPNDLDYEFIIRVTDKTFYQIRAATKLHTISINEFFNRCVNEEVMYHKQRFRTA